MIGQARQAIDPTRHAFSGFAPEDGVDAILAGHPWVNTAPLEIAVYRNALYVPPDASAPEPWETGGLMTAAGDLIPIVRDWSASEQILLGLRAPVAADASEVIEGDVLALGWPFEQFGHVMLETLARAWAFTIVPETTRVLLCGWQGMDLPETTLRVLALFGIGRERIIAPDRPVRLRSLLVPDPTTLITSMAHERAADLFRDVAQRITGDAPPSEQPLYLSRTALSSDKRQVIGELALEDVLRDNGFLIAYPETMPLEEQVRLVASHRTIALCKGGAAELLLFARPGTRVHLFTARPMLEVNVVVHEAARLDAVYHNALRWRLNPFAAARLDLDAAIAGLAADGLLPNLSRRPYLPASDDLDAEFEETWLAGMLTSPIPMDDAAYDAATAILDRIRPTAWPVFATLAARMPADRLDDAQADLLMTLFAAALQEETDANRRYRHAAQARELALEALARCTPPTQALVLAAIEERLPLTR